MNEFSPRFEISRRLLEYWESCRGDRPIPGRADIDPMDMAELLPFLLMVNVTHDPLDFSYRLIGTGIVDHSVRDYTGIRLMDIPTQARPSDIWTLYETAVVERRPVMQRIPYLRIAGKFVEMQALPLSADGETVNMLIGSVSFEHEIDPHEDGPAI